ncbi:MAG: hypothetical protein ACI8PW_000570 [Methylophilaceae bacterium]|jgi:hypothetical protein
MATNENEYEYGCKYIPERWEQLNKLLISATDDSIKYLFTVNAGGCVAILAFIGSAKEYKTTMLIILGILFLGLILVGCLNIARYLRLSKIIKKWTENSTEFYLKKIDFNLLIESDNLEVEKGKHVEYWAYASFTCVIIAGLIGFFELT